MANVQNSIAQYPKGFTNGVTIRGVPILNSYGGNVWYVDSNGAQIGDGKFNRPFATIDTAINHASAGDIIVVKAGHTETLVAAGAITLDVAGISVIGEGTGNNRPKLTFTPLAVGTAPVSWTAANVSFENIVCIAGLDAMTTPFAISGAQAYLDIEWQDASASIEAETVILTTAAADKLTINLTYRGFPAGNACVSPIKLAGCTDGRINLDFYGLASTAVVEFVTTLSTNILITGYAYNSTDTTGAKLVVDTIGSSLGYASIYAGAAGALYKGGSATTWTMSGDPTIATVTDALYDTNGVTAWPTAAKYGNGVSLAEVIGYIQDGVRRGTGTAMAANKSVADALGTDGSTVTDSAVTVLGAIGANSANNSFSSATVASNLDGSVLERLEYLKDQANIGILDRNTASYFAVTADLTNATWNTVAAHEIATVTGCVRMQIVPEITGTITSAGGAGTLVLGDETTTNSLITSTDAEDLAQGEFWFDATATRTVANKTIYEKLDFVVANGKDIGYTIGGEALTGGTIVFHCWWVPINATGAVAAGAGAAL